MPFEISKKILVKLELPKDIFAQQVKFKVDFPSFDKPGEVCMLPGKGNDGYCKPVFFYIKCGQGDTVYTNRAFFNNQRSEFFGKGETDLPATTFGLYFLAK